MTATTLQKVIMIYMCINVMLYVAGVRLIGDSTDYLSQYVTFEEDGNINPSELLTSTLPRDFNNPVQTESLTFIDSLGASQNFVSFMINILFTPLGLLKGAGFGTNGLLMVGVPLMTMGFLGMAYFIRSGA